jgi:hypothetical protein
MGKFTVRELADIFGVDKPAIHYHRRKGSLRESLQLTDHGFVPFSEERRGNNTRPFFTVKDVDDWMERTSSQRLRSLWKAWLEANPERALGI